MDIHSGVLWIEEQKAFSLDLLKKWANINSWSKNISGLEMMAKTLADTFQDIADEWEAIPLSQGSHALSFSKRKTYNKQILLGGHMDTVYPPSSPFQTCKETKELLIGPGVADMKGGLVVLYLALTAFEKFHHKKEYGWEVFITPDEEISSLGSRPLWEGKAKQAQFALLFEPSFSNGDLVDKRKGSMDFHLKVIGTPAHAGRDFFLGKSAIKSICRYLQEAYLIAEKFSDLTFNPASLHSEHPLNVVAPTAECLINIRSFSHADLLKMESLLHQLAKDLNLTTETEIILDKTGGKDPKPFTKETKELFWAMKAAANELGLNLSSRESGGLSDGNILAKAGLPNLDTLGVIGGNLHTPNEYMEIKSMVERAKLVFVFLSTYSQGLLK